MTNQGDLPVAFQRAAVRFDVAESDYLLLHHYNMLSLSSMAYKLPKAEDLENFLKDLVLDRQAYKADDGEIVVYRRTPAAAWGVWKLSDDAAAIRRLWSYAKETAKGEMERMASGDETRRKTTMMELVAMETAAVARGCTAPTSDRERVSLFTLNKASKSMVSPGATYEVMPWEAYISKEEEDRLMREGKLPKTHQAELVLSRDYKVVAKEGGESLVGDLKKVGDLELLRQKLELRARTMEMLDLARFNTMRSLTDKYLGRLNATIASGMRHPTLNELRRFDREMFTEIFRHLSRGKGNLEDAVAYYVQGDDPLWKLLDPVLTQLPDQGLEGDHTGSTPKTGEKKRKAEPAEPAGPPIPEPPERRLKTCLVCKKAHVPLCPLPENFRAEQRAKRKAKRVAAGKAKAKSDPAP